MATPRAVVLNVASSGPFSSDRTIVQYAAEIWNVVPCATMESARVGEGGAWAGRPPELPIPGCDANPLRQPSSDCPGTRRLAGRLADMVEIDARGLDAEHPRHYRA
ncbi:MAG: glycogen/starch/alpha-glucan phosphorylase [Bryobacteraceae bacterium]